MKSLWKINMMLYLRIKYKLLNKQYWLKKYKWLSKVKIKKYMILLAPLMYSTVLYAILAAFLLWSIVCVMHFNRSFLLGVMSISKKYKDILYGYTLLGVVLLEYITLKELIISNSMDSKKKRDICFTWLRFIGIPIILVILGFKSVNFAVSYIDTNKFSFGKQSVQVFYIFSFVLIYYIRYLGGNVIGAFTRLVPESKDRISITVSVCTAVIALISIFC